MSSKIVFLTIQTPKNAENKNQSMAENNILFRWYLFILTTNRHTS